MKTLLLLCFLWCGPALFAAGLPDNADACLRKWYYDRHTNDPPSNAWRLIDERDGNGIRIAEWNLPDPKPSDAQVHALTNAAVSHVESRKADTSKWTRRERVMFEMLYQVNLRTTNAMSRAQFRAKLMEVWDGAPD